MNEAYYWVFGTDGIISVRGYGASLPEELRGFPVICFKNSIYRVQINTLVTEDEYVYESVRKYILDAFRVLETAGAVRVEFPAWFIMDIYAVERSASEEPYWDVDQLLDSFLSLRGPEMIL